MELTGREKSYIWLDSFALSDTEKRKLLLAAGSAVGLLKNFSKFKPLLIEFGKESLYNIMSASLCDGGKYFAGVLEGLKTQGITPLAYGSARYPKAWLQLADAPLVLYAKGNLSLLQTRIFCVVGSRRTPLAILKLAENICEELSQSVTLLTGVADGADTAVIEGALKGGKPICMLAGGLGSAPKNNPALLKAVEEKGLLLAPHQNDVPVLAYSYEYRNKLLAALCEGALVLSAGEKSGALITAKYAREFGKKLFALPYAPMSASGIGCNELIKNGAKLTECAKDVLSEFGLELKTRRAVELTETELLAVEYLKQAGEAHVTELAEHLKLPMFKIPVLLSALEMKGVVIKLGGNRYSAV
ncbi:MAG: DNA-protecting protein DprA [Clostridia bacterium]|nr:DNA-protecting protein DprA [Clostridia bacterium]